MTDTISVSQVRDAIAAEVPKLRERLAAPVAEMWVKYGHAIAGDAIETMIRGAVEVGIREFVARVESQLATK